MKSVIFSIISIVLFYGCNKPASEYPPFLKGDTSVFIGQWTWQYSDHHFGFCDNLSLNETVTPSSLGEEHQIIIGGNGVMKHIVNGSESQRLELFITKFDENGSCISLGENYTKFSVDLNNDNDNIFWGCIKSDTLIVLSALIFDDYEEACENYSSFFVKQ